MYAVEAPEYFPGLRLCALLVSVDTFIVNDGLQYSRQSFQNRARLRTPDGIQWITVPVVGGQFGRSIAETKIDHSTNWRRKHLKALSFNYGTAPYFEHYFQDIGNLLSVQYDTLGELTTASMRLVSEALAVSGQIAQLNEDTPDVHDSLSSAHGRRTVLETKKKRDREMSIDECVIPFESPEYRQNFDGFESGLSILDLLFNHGPEAKRIVQSGIKCTTTENP